MADPPFHPSTGLLDSRPGVVMIEHLAPHPSSALLSVAASSAESNLHVQTEDRVQAKSSRLLSASSSGSGIRAEEALVPGSGQRFATMKE